jgi:hypothetical protein
MMTAANRRCRRLMRSSVTLPLLLVMLVHVTVVVMSLISRRLVW